MLLCKTPCRIQGVYQERTNTLTFVLKRGGWWVVCFVMDVIQISFIVIYVLKYIH